jgi:hypothetical protein
MNISQQDIDPDTVKRDFYKYISQYRSASAALETVNDAHWPKLLIRGMLVELTLKVYLLENRNVAWGHNLEELSQTAGKRGLTLTSSDHRSIISSLNQYYFRETNLNVKYLARYPMPNRPTLVSITPGHQLLDNMIQRILDQAAEVRQQTN